MATDAELDSAVRRVLLDLLSEGTPYNGLPLVNLDTNLFPDAITDAIRQPLADGITDLEELTENGRLGEDQLSATFASRGYTIYEGDSPYIDITPDGGYSAFHIHSGSSFTGPYMIGIGVDHEGVTGQTISVKKGGVDDGEGGTTPSRGLYVDMQIGITDEDSYGFYGKQASPGDMIRLESVNGVNPKGPLVRLITRQYDANQRAMFHETSWPGYAEGQVPWWVKASDGSHHFAGTTVRLGARRQRKDDGTFSGTATDDPGRNDGMRARSIGGNKPVLDFAAHAGADTYWQSRIYQDQNVLKIGVTTDPADAATTEDGSSTFDTAISISGTTGTRSLQLLSGNSVGYRLGFYGATPVARPAAVADAAGGATVDSEARAAINTLLAAVRSLGLIAT